jgi:hypothetical protein
MSSTAQQHPQSKSAMIMGIVSIFFSFSLIGLILAVMARVRARRALAEMEATPDAFDQASATQAQVARHTSNVSLLLSIVWLLVIIVAVRG